ncbi:DUF1376 domain-containing protein [Sphingobium sp. JS3065]|uniref:DUF1376 domain-containing protein n=1 Tax=Sphingobium sp. JS3065 TaxID=2970925 RepID=UPI0022645F0D|nr:DUF1376 domain-containing protein [Sphingobium sp. JS3065]UZW54948.1 DUF1376 domain-containing protein [Sphingobium sp. JS3065]
MAEFPALPIWTDAYLADTRHLSTLEHGAYFLLMMEAWRRPTCSLPDDDAMLARLAGLDAADWAAVKPVIMSLWKLDRRSKTWTQKRLSKEKQYVRKKSKSQKEKAAKRWNKAKKADAVALPDECPEHAPTPTPTPTVIIEEPIGSSRPPAPDHVSEAFGAYEAMRREIVHGARPLQLGADRRKKLALRLGEIGGLRQWDDVLSAVRRSPFLRGEKSRSGLVATIDWLLEPKNLRKVMEGNYDEPAATCSGGRLAVRNSPIDALSFAISASGLDR